MSTSQPAMFAESVGRHAAPAPGTTAAELQLRVRSVPLGGGRVLHTVLTMEDDAPAHLLLAAGFASDDLLRLLGGAVSVPVAALPDLRAALDALASGGA